MAGKKKEVDWPTLELDYRAGVKSMRMLSKEYCISTARIGQVANQRRWSRDLAVKIRERAQAKLYGSIVDGILDAETAIAKEDRVVETAAEIPSSSILRHRCDIVRARRLAMALFGELETATADNERLCDLTELMETGDTNGRLTEVYKNVISMPSRVDVLKKLSDTLRILIALEREAFGINRKEADGSGAVDAVVKRVLAK